MLERWSALSSSLKRALVCNSLVTETDFLLERKERCLEREEAAVAKLIDCTCKYPVVLPDGSMKPYRTARDVPMHNHACALPGVPVRLRRSYR